MKNVSWPVGVWEAIGKEIRTKGNGYVGSAISTEIASLWSHSSIAHNLCERACSDTPPTKEEYLAYLRSVKA